ncbi:MAG: WD40 repeat domain-containing protein [Planctomycetes bacterium]|nr:WD40 repeat domain-containing protein [Planctomycetota bacterium]
MKTSFHLCPILLCLAFSDAAWAQAKGKPYIEPPAVHCLALSPDGTTLALAERAGNIRLWHVADRKDLRVFPIGVWAGSYISTLAFSPDGKTLAVAGSGRLEVWDIETGKLRMTFKNQVKAIVARVVRGDDGVLREVREPIMRADDVMSASFSKDGKTLFSCGKENVIKVWDSATGMEKTKLTGQANASNHLALSANGKVLAAGMFEREIKVWDLDTQKEIASLDNDRASVYGLALSADGKRLLSSSGADVILWDLGKKEPLRRVKAARGVGRVAFSPDEKLVVAKANGYMVWDAATLEHLATLEYSPVGSFAITPDSKTLITCDKQGNVKLHELPRR